MMFMIRPFMTVIMRLMIFFNSPLKVPVQKSSEYQNFSTLFESGGGHVFAYNCANKRTSALKNLTFPKGRIQIIKMKI